jgi:hypothetical protein
MCLSLFLVSYDEVGVTQNDQPEPAVASGKVLPLCCLSLLHRKFCAISSTPPEAAVFERKHGFLSLGLFHPLKVVSCIRETVVAWK